jgi:hypothetical protein
MPVRHDFECPKGHITEQTVDVNAAGWQKQPCGVCSRAAERVFLSSRSRSFLDAKVVVYRDAGGHTIYPGSANEKMPDRYAKLGYERVEMDFHAARRFQNAMNKEERLKMSHYLETLQRTHEEEHAQDRSDLRQAMRNMSPMGREFAQYVMDIQNSRDARRYISSDPGFHNEALEG